MRYLKYFKETFDSRKKCRRSLHSCRGTFTPPPSGEGEPVFLRRRDSVRLRAARLFPRDVFPPPYGGGKNQPAASASRRTARQRVAETKLPSLRGDDYRHLRKKTCEVYFVNQFPPQKGGNQIFFPFEGEKRSLP